MEIHRARTYEDLLRDLRRSELLADTAQDVKLAFAQWIDVIERWGELSLLHQSM